MGGGWVTGAGPGVKHWQLESQESGRQELAHGGRNWGSGSGSAKATEKAQSLLETLAKAKREEDMPGLFSSAFSLFSLQGFLLALLTPLWFSGLCPPRCRAKKGQGIHLRASKQMTGHLP